MISVWEPQTKAFVFLWGGGAFFAPSVHVDRGGVCRMSTLVHSRGGGGQKLVKIGPRSC